MELRGVNITNTNIVAGGSVSPPPTLVLSLDAAGYTSGPWVDSVSSRSFTLYGSPTYSPSIGGGSFDFDPSSSQYAQCNSSLSNLTTWTAIAWHFYTGANTGTAPCILTEVFPSGTNQINYSLGSIFGATNTDLTSGFFNGAWRNTPTGYSLPTSGWYQIVGTYDGTDNKLYVNNTLVQSANYSGTPAAGTAGIRLMRRWDDPEYWAGRLAIIQVYDGAFDATAVTNNWNANKARFGL